jgi:hypothetical protein
MLSMAITEDDASLARDLRRLLIDAGASWVVDEVDAEPRFSDHIGQDATGEAEALLLGISRTVGAIPAMLHEANEILGTNEAAIHKIEPGEPLAFSADHEELLSLAHDAYRLAEPVADALDAGEPDEY